MSTGTLTASVLNPAPSLGKRAVSVTTSINDFIAGLNNPISYLNSDKVIIEKYFSGDSGAIKSLETQISTLNATMQKDNETNARGASKQGLGVLIITIVVVAQIFKKSDEEEGQGDDESDEASNKIIEASVDMIKNDIKEQTDATKQWNESFASYQKLVVSLSTDEQLYTAVVQLCNSLASLRLGQLCQDAPTGTQSRRKARPYRSPLASVLHP